MSNSTEKQKSCRTPRREVRWIDLGAKNRTLESIKRHFEDRLDRFLPSSSNSLLRYITSSMDSKLRHNLHQCPGYLREEITLVSDVSKSVIVSHAFPSQSEVCSICGQLVQYNCTEPSIVDSEKLEDSHYPSQHFFQNMASPSSSSIEDASNIRVSEIQLEPETYAMIRANYLILPFCSFSYSFSLDSRISLNDACHKLFGMNISKSPQYCYTSRGSPHNVIWTATVYS